LNFIEKKWLVLNDDQLIMDEVFEVKCKIGSISYENVFAQIINKFDKKMKKKLKSNCKPLDVMLISYDSVSRSSWLQRLPKTNEFIFKNMKFDILKGYNIVGDGTPAALIPILTGKEELELPNVLRNFPNARYVDEAYPFIWKELHEENYMSLYLGDNPILAPFSYRMKGFLNHTCHHYFRHFKLKMIEKKYLKNDLCVGARKLNKILLDLIYDFKKEYNNLASNFLISHFVQYSHDSNERLNWIDNDLFEFLKNGYYNGLFKNTAIFLYSDHGQRFVDKRSARKQRYLDERLPFFAVYLPKSYKIRNQAKYNNLRINSNLLTSPFDIYATIRDLTCLKTNTIDEKSRSISLLDKISLDRNCEHIGISDHYCTCVQNWTDISIRDQKIDAAVRFAIKSINEITKARRYLCSELELLKIISADILDKYIHKIFKIQFMTFPNKGIYEINVIDTFKKDFEFNSNEFSLKSRSEISRIDAYDSQPKCLKQISDQLESLDLRKFCFCKELANFVDLTGV
jgi:hypothetical protein